MNTFTLRFEEQPESEESSARKRLKTSKHVVGYSVCWKDEFPWLEPLYSEGVVTGMLCSLCKRYSTKNKRNKTTVWSETPCMSLHKDSVRRHSKSEQHKGAIELEKYRQTAEKDGGIPQALHTEVSLQKKAIKGAMQCLYWLVHSEIPHTTKYSSLIDAVKLMGCDYFKHLHQGENAKYKSKRIIQEFLEVLAKQIEEKQLQELSCSTFFSLMINESTDVAVVNEMVVYARYLTATKNVKTGFMKIIELLNGTAETIETALLKYLENKSLPLAKFVGFGTDGEKVMTGRVNGVAARLKRHQPILTSIHCVCHRLALAAAQAGKDVPFINKKFKPTLSQLFYFYQNSPVRMSGLKAIEELLEMPALKLKKAADTRWLSHESACRTLVKVLPAVLVSLAREAEERGDALAYGLDKIVRQYNFIATLYMMCDVLPAINRLSCILQSTSVNFSQLHMLVSTTIHTLEMLRANPGFQLNKLDSDLQDSLAQSNISAAQESKQNFHQKIYIPFLNALISHIQERLPDTGVFAAFAILDPTRLPPTLEEALTQKYGDAEVDILQKQYGKGEFVDEVTFKHEWNELRCYLSMHCRSLLMLDVLQLLAKSELLCISYPNFAKLAEVCLTLPIHTADCERAFSTMRRVKSRLRSELTNNTLNHCMRISIEGPPLEEFNFDKAVEMWSQLKQRLIMS